MCTGRTFEALEHAGRVALVPATGVVDGRAGLFGDGGLVGEAGWRQVEGRDGLGGYEGAVALEFFFKATSRLHLLYRTNESLGECSAQQDGCHPCRP